MSLISRLRGPGKSGFGYGSTAADVTRGLDLSGQTFLVTGCNSGLGQETVRTLGAAGAHVVGAARTKEKATAALAGLAHATAVACELSEPDSVRTAVATVAAGPPLDGIICNAGIMALPRLERRHGLELQFLTNHIGHFMLVTGLLDRLTSSGRVVMVSSNAHFRAPKEGIEFDNLDGAKRYNGWLNYGQSKLANILFANELALRLPSGQTANALHPGVIRTNLGRHLPAAMDAVFGLLVPLVLKSIPEGAATQCYVATHPSLARVRGKYFADCNLKAPSRHGRDPHLATRLWNETEAIVSRL
ncbi:MAG: SDR family NAD(P)-dependent oxidoreductase [Myxococcota bacterium]